MRPCVDLAVADHAYGAAHAIPLPARHQSVETDEYTNGMPRQKLLWTCHAGSRRFRYQAHSHQCFGNVFGDVAGSAAFGWINAFDVETEASLTWLTTGKGARFMEVEESRVVIAKHKKISNGILEPMDDFILDKASLPEGLNAPFVINADRSTYLVDIYEGEIVDGLWLIEIDKLVSIRELVRFPGGRIFIRVPIK